MRLRTSETVTLLHQATLAFITDNALSRAAAISFYAATALAPVLLIVISIAGIVVGPDAAQVAVSAQLSGLLGPQGADLLQSVVEGASDKSQGVLAASVAIITLLISASGVFGEMQAALNQIWRVEVKSASLSALVRARAASLGLVASLGFLLLVSLLASAAISALGNVINNRLPVGSLLLSTLNTIVSMLLIALLFGAIYKVLPDRSIAWRDIRFGAIVTAVLFTIGKSLIGWYLGTSALASSYGAAGSIIILLLWVFYSSAIFLLGAEITRAYAVRLGSRRDLRSVVSEKIPLEVTAARNPTMITPMAAVAVVASVSSVAALLARWMMNRDSG